MFKWGFCLKLENQSHLRWNFTTTIAFHQSHPIYFPKFMIVQLLQTTHEEEKAESFNLNF